MSGDWNICEETLVGMGLNTDAISAILDNMNEHEVVLVMEMLSLGTIFCYQIFEHVLPLNMSMI